MLPAVREAPKDTILIADGFGCREQMARTTDRRALHLAQVLRMAKDAGDERTVPGDYLERAYPGRAPMSRARKIGTAAAVAGTGAAVRAWWLAAHKRHASR